jgi:asparagine synthase (glutamine-hydrolysing)
MCGIAGIVRQQGSPVTTEEIKRMTDAIVHRGPDASGAYFADGIGLGVRRLRIIDLITGDQPIANEDGSIWTVFNGEIYNFLELREQLGTRGHIFRTRSDTEVIVHAYEEYGDAFVERLRGMFAVAVWDGRTSRLVLARDRFGKKPLLYTALPKGLVFASEMQALVRVEGISRELDVGALGNYLSYGYVPAPATIFRSIKKVPPGHLLTWERGEIGLRCYWKLRYDPKHVIDEREALMELERRLDEAVRIRLIADVPLGALLSGGVDSSTIVALMARHSPGRVKTFSIGFEDSAYDELAHARRVAQRYDTDHHELVVRPEAAEILPLLVRNYGEPYADSSAIPTYYVAKMARQHVTVALNGDGGDEAFAGYDRYRAMQWANTIARLPGSSVALGLAAAATALPGVPQRARVRAARFLGTAHLPAVPRYASWMSVIRPELLAELVTSGLREAFAAARPRTVEAALETNSSLGPVDRLLATDVSTYLADDLLVKMDIATMANSLETRSPLLDQEVVEFAAALPERFKLGPGFRQKVLLKRLARKLIPAENVDRPKMGFGVPVGQWLRTDLRSLAEDALFSQDARKRGYFRKEVVQRLWNEHQDRRADRALPLWTLVMLELWHREFLP